MRERILQGEEMHGLVIRALEQTAGRGQRHRDWQSEQGGSYQTLALSDSANKFRHALTPIAVAVGIAQSFSEWNISLGVKWPNDLYFPFAKGQIGKKVAGILCEHVAGYLLVAAGVNVNNPVPENAAALSHLDLEQVNSLVLSGMLQGLGLLEASKVLDVYTHYDCLYDQKISLDYQGKTVVGTARGITNQGCLRILSQSETDLICHSEARGSITILK